MQADAGGTVSLEIGTPERMSEINFGENDPPFAHPPAYSWCSN